MKKAASYIKVDLERQKAAARWAMKCAEHVLPLFEMKYPKDDRPRRALEAGRAWMQGKLRVGPVRKAVLSAHAAAREAEDLTAKAAARAAGHAAATAHVVTHAKGGGWYAIKAVAAAAKSDPAAAVEAELRWQRRRLPKRMSSGQLAAVSFRNPYP